MKRALCSVLGILGTACGTTPTAGAPDYQLTDLTGAYVEFFDYTQELAPDARVAAFKSEMNARMPGFYSAERMPGVTPEQYDADIARSFTDFPERRAAFMRTASSFEAMLRPAINSFVGTFNDFHSVGRIALLHSLGEMDAGTRTVSGQSYLVFGVDVIARLHAPGNERPFFHHELFHVYNGQFFSECEALWCALWMEGLAVYVSEQLNPGATDADLLLTSPGPIRPGVDANLPRAVRAIRARLDSTVQQDYAAFFYGNSSFENLPPRSGYYLGYMALKQAGKSRSLSALAHLNNAEARAVLESALAELAPDPSP